MQPVIGLPRVPRLTIFWVKKCSEDPLFSHKPYSTCDLLAISPRCGSKNSGFPHLIIA